MKSVLGKIIRKLQWILSLVFGIDPLVFFRFLRGLPRYLRDLLRFRRGYTGRLKLFPCMNDWYEEGGDTKGEYFLQDLLVARMIFKAQPHKHVDIGSRIDGFVAHVAVYREIEVLDIRPVTQKIPGVIFKQADCMNPVEGMDDYCDSLSCLHTLEHFGLGRYGDAIDVQGFIRGLANMAKMVKTNGVFYLSVPIGIDRVEFNANRVFDPRVIVNLAKENSLRLSSFVVIREGGIVEYLQGDESQLAQLARQRYALGIFIFVKER